MNLSFNISFNDLYTFNGLEKIHTEFLNYVKVYNESLYSLLTQDYSSNYSSNVLIELSYLLDQFIVELFNIKYEVKSLKVQHEQFLLLYQCKRSFVQRYALKLGYKSEDLNLKSLKEQLKQYFVFPLDEFEFAKQVLFWLDHKDDYATQLELAAQYAVVMVSLQLKSSILFNLPQKLDHNNLVPVEIWQNNGIDLLKSNTIKPRDGFNLTSEHLELNKALNEAHYCIFCHNQGKDSCSKGALSADNTFKKSFFGSDLAGCPLQEKISEMNSVKSKGFIIAPLAIVMIDNPLCVLTGYRICNDCSKSCIYQKQDAVNIPMIETRVVNDVLELPYGFEIYSLLTRWNPLNFGGPLPKKSTGKSVLVVGLGPAGIALSHYLLQEGHYVVAIDGLKIEPIAADISGVTQSGQRVDFIPIKNIKDQLFENLADRVVLGFGGVAEYGITVRWNKNYLKVARLILERRSSFIMFGGILFGATITIDDAFNLGFSHIALALGSGKPNIVQIKNAFARGVRMASDFLMSLQLSSAFSYQSIANLQLRMPIVVIGGGLTAIDIATEAMAYYVVQVEKFLNRYEILVDKYGKEWVEHSWGEEDQLIAREFITHAKAIREERKIAESEKRECNLVELLQLWGGAKIVYRKNFTAAPSYRLNNEEVKSALEEGVHFIENSSVVEVILDQYNHIKAVKIVNRNNEINYIDAKSLIVATGTSPNTVIFEENPEYFREIFKESLLLDKSEFLVYKSSKGSISIFGDLHPFYHGSVVKAIASAKNGYSEITKVLKECKKNYNAGDFLLKFYDLLVARITCVKRLTHNVVEIIIKAPQAVINFKPGQFYKLQNFASNSINVANTKLSMEGIAVTGTFADKKHGTISTIVLETGGSSNLCYYLQEGEPVILMGPTGVPTEIPSNQNVMLIGGGVGNAVLFSLGKAMLGNKCKVLYFAGYKKFRDLFKKEIIEQSSNVVVWACDEGKIEKTRKDDKSYHGNIIDAILSYAEGKLGEVSINLRSIDRVVIIGSHKMMEAFARARNTILNNYFKDDVKIIASVNSPMQCMMKEICAQCLQKHIDKGKEYFVYSCRMQDQKIDSLCFNHLNDRLTQNRLQENLTLKWVGYCLSMI